MQLPLSRVLFKKTPYGTYRDAYLSAFLSSFSAGRVRVEHRRPNSGLQVSTEQQKRSHDSTLSKHGQTKQ